MSMREAFEKWYADKWSPAPADCFKAGYQAAIADVRAGGVCGFTSPWNLENKPSEALYKLPEDV